MSAYRLFEAFAVAAFLLYSLRQILPLFPAMAARLTRLAQWLGVSPAVFLPGRYTVPRSKGCASCDGCSTCGPAEKPAAQVITLHRSKG